MPPLQLEGQPAVDAFTAGIQLLHAEIDMETVAVGSVAPKLSPPRATQAPPLAGTLLGAHALTTGAGTPELR